MNNMNEVFTYKPINNTIIYVNMMKLRKTMILASMFAMLPLTGCRNEAMYEFAYDGVAKLQTLIEYADTLYLKHLYHGQPPVGEYGPIVLIIFSVIGESQIRENDYFAYEDEDTYYLGLDAVSLYDYRDHYVQLDVSSVNDHFGFEL